MTRWGLSPLLMVPFLLLPGMRDYAYVQSIGAALLVLVLLLVLPSEQRKVDRKSLIWLVWPTYMFVRAQVGAEFFSEYALWACTMAMLVPLVNAMWPISAEYKVGLFVLGALYGVQVLGILGWLPGAGHFNYKSLFGQENIYQFVNLMGLGMAFYMVQWSNVPRHWKALAVVALAVGLISLFTGDYWCGGPLGLSGGDSVAVQLGLGCGMAFGGLLWGCRRLGWKKSGVLLAGLLFLLLVMLPWWAQLIPWSAGASLSVSSRVALWKAAWGVVLHHPWGTGGAALASRLFDYWPTVQESDFLVKTYFNVAHNHFLHATAETGWLGGLLVVGSWGGPLLACVRRYLQTGERRFQYFAAWMLAVLVTLALSEVTQLFTVPNLLAWVFLLRVFQELEWNPSWNKSYRVPRIAYGLLVPVVGLLVWDRGMQLRSYQETNHLEQGAALHKEDVEHVRNALHFHAKNQVALYFSAELARATRDYEKSAQAIQAIEDMSGPYLANRMWAVLYHDMGKENRACERARWQLRFSANPNDLEQLAWARSCP